MKEGKGAYYEGTMDGTVLKVSGKNRDQVR